MYRSSLHRLIALAWVIFAAGAANAARPAAVLARALEPYCRLYLDPHDKFTRVIADAPRDPLAARQVVSNVSVRYNGFTSQAQIAFQAAVDIWQTQVASSVPLVVDATFADLGNTSLLGSAGFGSVARDFAGAPRAATWFPGPIANKLSGTDRNGATVEITARFNSTFNWYYGTDGLVPSGQVDFVSVVLHELGHGLGFVGSASVSSGKGYVGATYPYIYDVPVVDATGVSILDDVAYPSGSAALATLLTGGGAFWDGANGKSANGGARPKLYTPASYSSGSTYSHLDESTYPSGNLNSLMTPMLGYAEAIHVPGPIVSGMFNDMGWGTVCSLGLDHAAQTVTAGASASLKLAVSAAPTCTWTASTSSSFVHLTSGTSAIGAGLLRFSVDANAGASLRQATITIAAGNFSESQSFTLTQAGSCTYALDKSSASIAAEGGAISVGVAAAAGCDWSAAVSSGSFASITSGASGTGNGAVVLTVPAYSGSTVRITTVTIAGQTFTVFQQAPCSYALSTTNASVNAAGGAFDVTVTTGTGCAWTASTASTFVTLSGGTSVSNGVVTGSGTGTVTLTTAANPTTSQRVATLTIAAQAYTVTQSGLPTPVMSLERSALIFGAVGQGASFTARTPAQLVRLTQTGATGAVSWTAASSQPWLTVTPSAGIGSATLSVGVQFASGVPASGSSNATVTLTYTGASTPSATIGVTLNTLTQGSLPFGSFDTPAAGGTSLQGSIAVSGWALDDVAVNRIEIWRDLQIGETTPPFASTPDDPRRGKVFIANATFVDGARPDVEKLYGSLPIGYRGGWGYLLLTQGLWNGGNGSYTLHAFAFDEDAHVVSLGQKTISVNNQAANRPFGSIDTPGIGSTVTGTVVNFGWALTPPVNGAATCRVPPAGVQVSIDSGPLQPVVFGDARTDIASAFTGLTNSAAAGGHFTIDTTALANGVHTIGWLVTDDCNRAEGIGSRFFTVNNGSLTVLPSVAAAQSLAFDAVPDTSREPLLVSHGRGALATIVDGDSAAERRVVVAQAERIELRLPRGFESVYQLVNGDRRALPIGSTWDTAARLFAWQPAAPFLGEYQLVFTRGAEQLRVLVVVTP